MLLSVQFLFYFKASFPFFCLLPSAKHSAMAEKNVDKPRATECLQVDSPSGEKLVQTVGTSSEHGAALERALLSQFTKYRSENVSPNDLFPLLDTLMENGTRRVKKELHERRKELTTSPKTLLFCPSCGCVFESPITLTCGHTTCLNCLQRLSDSIKRTCLDGNVSLCCLCGVHYGSDAEHFSENLVLSDIISKRFPEKAKQKVAKKLGKSYLLSNSPKEAVDSFSFALFITPKDYDCLCLRSDAYMQLKLHYLALRDAYNASKLRPDLPDAFYRKANIFTTVRMYDDATTDYLRCAILSPNDSDRRDDFTNSLIKVLTSRNVTALELKIVARNLVNIFVTGGDLSDEGIVAGVQEADGQNNEVQDILELVGEKTAVVVDDLRCSVCGCLLFQPVTIQCGHTFCQDCLKESLEYGSICPKCRKTVNASVERERKCTVVIDKLLKVHFGHQYLERRRQRQEKIAKWKRIGSDERAEIPILVSSTPISCDQVQLTLPEPRARIMIRRCIVWGSGMFGICAPSEDAEKGLADRGTLVEIQATKRFPDGNVVVQAVPRHKFTVISHEVIDGCLAARVKWQEGTKIDDGDTTVLLKWRNAASHAMLKKWISSLPLEEKTCIETALGPMPPCGNYLLSTQNGPSWLLWALAALPFDPPEKLRILIMPRVIDRLQSIQNFVCLLLKLMKRTKQRSKLNG